MADFHAQDLKGSTFSDVELNDSTFRMVDFTGSTFTAAGFRDVRFRSVDLIDVEITGDIENVTINGVEVASLIDAELNRRDPERVKMRPETPEGFREAWVIIGRRWDETVAKARALPPEKLHESVDGEWSFIETLRHLVFASEAWVGRGILLDPSPWDQLSLPWDDMPDTEGVPRDRSARPSLDEVLALRADRMAMVARVLDDLTVERLASHTEAVEGPGWPPPVSLPVRDCLLTVLNEEWEHRNYAERDLAQL